MGPWSLFHLQMTLVVLGLGCALCAGRAYAADYVRMIEWLRLRDPEGWRAIGSPALRVDVRSWTPEQARRWMRFVLGLDLHADPEVAAIQARCLYLWVFMGAGLAMMVVGALAIPLARTAGLL